MKKLLIFSGNSSIGISIIKEFLKNNYVIYATFNKKKILIKDNNLHKIKLDIKNINEIKKFQKKISKIKFDYVIFCSGKIYGKNFSKYTFKEAKNLFDINFFSPLNVFKEIIRNIKQSGLCLFISSISSEQGSFDPFYASSKASLNMMIKNLTKEYSHKMRLLTLSPSLIEKSKMYFDMSKNNRKKHINKNPQKSLLKKDDLAKILLDLEKNYWKKLNGINLNLNGGL
jgi:short-subunit dehydrogenase